MEGIVIQTENLSKFYGEKRAVEEVNLCVNRGEVYGFLGPNGAGKTTVMMMLLGLLVPTKGKITILEEPFGGRYPWVRCRIGAVPEKPYLYTEMTAVEYLKFFADLYQVDHSMKKIRTMLEKMELSEAAENRLGTFSRGMQQKINIARGFIHDPELLLLDEPVSGLDPKGIRQVRDLIEEVKAKGKTVFISSHLLSEAEKVCDRVAIMNSGHLLVEETMAGIRERLVKESTIEVEVTDLGEKVLEAFSRFPFVKEVFREGNVLLLKTEPVEGVREKVSKMITETGGTVLSIKMRELSLEDAFLTLTDQNISFLTDNIIKK
jgi:ABC-2 type transport system ATP-binding protein